MDKNQGAVHYLTNENTVDAEMLFGRFAPFIIFLDCVLSK